MGECFHQLLPNFSPRDAIGNEALLIRETLTREGFKSNIYSLDGVYSDISMPAGGLAADLAGQSNAKVLFHYSVGSQLNKLWPKLNCERWLRYHNITPTQFFQRADELHARHMCGLGRIQLRAVVGTSQKIIADSEYNASEIKPFTNQTIQVVPVFRDYHKLLSRPVDNNLIAKISDSSVLTVLFVGRVSPNKCHHDLLQLLALHRKISSRKVRLIFAGGYFSDSYKYVIQEFAGVLGLKLTHDWDFNADVMCLGSVSDEQLTTLYRSATLYASLSEHEGFGVPIVEAMYFDLPVFAHRCTAIPEILGNGEFLVDKFNWPDAVQVFEKALIDTDVRCKEIERAKKWRERFGLVAARELFTAVLKKQ